MSRNSGPRNKSEPRRPWNEVSKIYGSAGETMIASLLPHRQTRLICWPTHEESYRSGSSPLVTTPSPGCLNVKLKKSLEYSIGDWRRFGDCDASREVTLVTIGHRLKSTIESMNAPIPGTFNMPLLPLPQPGGGSGEQNLSLLRRSNLQLWRCRANVEPCRQCAARTGS